MNNLIRKLDNCIDFRFIEDLEKELSNISGKDTTRERGTTLKEKNIY